jgi:hypothetical protein
MLRTPVSLAARAEVGPADLGAQVIGLEILVLPDSVEARPLAGLVLD